MTPENAQRVMLALQSGRHLVREVYQSGSRYTYFYDTQEGFSVREQDAYSDQEYTSRYSDEEYTKKLEANFDDAEALAFLR